MTKRFSPISILLVLTACLAGCPNGNAEPDVADVSTDTAGLDATDIGNDLGNDVTPSDTAPIDVATDSGDGSVIPPHTIPPRSTCTTHLTPDSDGGSSDDAVQTAFVDAAPGDVICFDDGTYRFTRSLSLSQANITIQGTADGAVLDFGGQTAGDNSLLATGNNFTIQYITIKNTTANGVRVDGADHVTFRKVHALWDAGSSMANGAYAIYPVGCGFVLVEDCEVEGAADAGIYVGQSHDVIVRYNVVHGNVAGIEFENCTDSCGYFNYAYDNTAGLLVFNLPGLAVMGTGHANLHDNTIESNNRTNFCHPGGIVCEVPAGLGVMVLAAAHTEITNNTIRRNQSAGVLVVDFRSATSGASLPDGSTYDPRPQQICIHDNRFASNGTMPEGELAPLGVLRPDIVWDGFGQAGNSCADNSFTQLCIHETTVRFVCADIPGSATPSADVSVHNCPCTGEACVSF